MSKQRPAFNGLAIAQRYRKELEVRLNTPDDPLEESKKQLSDSPFTGTTNLANTISNTIDQIDGKQGNRPFLGKQPLRLTDITVAPSSTQVKQRNVENPDERLVKAIIDESNKPYTLFGRETGMTKGQQSFLSNISQFYEERNKPLFQKAVERVYEGISEPTKKILRGFEGEGNIFEKGADISLGVIGSALGTIMSPMNFFSPASEDIGEQIGKVTTPEFGKRVGEFLPFLAMPNPIAFYGASLGSEVATDEVMKIIKNTDLSDKNKERILEGIGLGSFIATHRLSNKAINSITKGEIKTYLDKEIQNIDKRVLDSMNPKLQGEKQIDVRQYPKETQIEFKESETKPTEGLTQEKLPIDLLKEKKNAEPTTQKKVDEPIEETQVKPETKVEKQPYEMTKDEFIKEELPKRYRQIADMQEQRLKDTGDTGFQILIDANRKFADKLEKGQYKTQGGVNNPIAEHYESVKKALVEGKNVPKEVLKDYPDLQKVKTETKVEKPINEIKPIEEQVAKTPRNELPEILSNKIEENAKNKLAQISGAEVLRGNTRFIRENVGKGWEVTRATKGFTVSYFPEWFRRLGKSKKEIITALEKIIEDKGKDKGKLVEDLKAIIFEHLKNGEEDFILDSSGGKTKKVKRGEIPADAEINDFLSRFAKDEITLEELRNAYRDYEAETQFPFGANEKFTGEFVGEGFNKPSFKKSEDYLRPKGKGEETTPLFNQQTEVKGQEKLFTETKVNKNIEEVVKPQESTIERLRREALDEFKKNQTTNVGFNPFAYKNQIKYGAGLLKEGVTKFVDWSARMIKDLGEAIKPHLLRIWNEVKKFGEDLGKIALEKISDFIESKYNPAKPLKVMEGNLLDKDNPLVQKLNEKVSPDSPIAKQTGKTIITPKDEVVRQLRTADYYQNLLGEELVGKKQKEIKSILEGEVKENPNRIKYNIFKPANLGKDMNPLIKGAYQLLFDKREQFKKDFELFTQQTNKLIREARRSRSKFELIREDKQVFDYLEGKIKSDALTPQELKLANYLKDWFKQAEPIMTNKNARDNYVTHIKRGFLEVWKQEGFWDGVKSLFKETDKGWESQVVADIDLMMAKEKFNPFAITRKANMPYSRDLGKVMQTYGKLFFLKSHFDSIRPQINILNNLLGREGMINEKNFLKRYAKKMMGENIDNLTPEALRKVSSALMKFTGLRFLAWNLPAGIVNTAAGIADNFINLPIGTFGRGTLRFETKRGQNLIKNNNVVDVENLDAAIGLRQQLGKAIDMALFLPMRGGWKLPWGEHYIQGSAYLGMLTEKEFKTGKVSLSRHREILEKIGNIHGAYRDNLAPDAKQTIGTREALQFKLWMFAKVRNRWERYGSGLMKPLLTGKIENIKPENLRSIAKELGLIASAILVATDDDSPLKEPIQDILSDLYGVFNPRETAGSLRRGIPAVGTLVDLYDLVDSFLTQERYKTSNKKYGIKEGELKAPKKLERLIPIYRQYKKQVQENIQETKSKKLF